MSRLLGSPKSRLSRLLCTHKGLPETGFGFQPGLAAGLIALETLPSIPSRKARSWSVKVQV